MRTTTSFDMEVNRLLGWIANEMSRARLTGVQAAFLNERVKAFEAAHAAASIVVNREWAEQKMTAAQEAMVVEGQ